MYREHSLVVSGRGDVDDAGGLLALQVGDESGRQVGGLLQHVHVVPPARQRQQRAVLLLHLHLTMHLFKLRLLEAHTLRDA